MTKQTESQRDLCWEQSNATVHTYLREDSETEIDCSLVITVLPAPSFVTNSRGVTFVLTHLYIYIPDSSPEDIPHRPKGTLVEIGQKNSRIAVARNVGSYVAEVFVGVL